MYQIESGSDAIRARSKLIPRRFGWPIVSRTVIYLGLTSMFTDISSEMVSSILPLYLVLYLGLSPLQFGVVDGLYQGVTALVRVAGGFIADRSHRHKEVAAAGYALSAVCKLGMLAAGGVWTAVVGVIFFDRLGKGIRTAPRDALIALSTPTEELATAFGVHRSLDTVGAMLGPLVAFGLLAVIPGAYDTIFVASFSVALIGLGVLGLFVENQPGEPEAVAGNAVSIRFALERLAAPQFRVLVLAGTALALVTVSDGFLYLTLQRRLSFSAGWLPLLYVATSLAYFVLAIPMGQLADRVGRWRVFVTGHVLLLAIYGALLLPTIGLVELGACLLLFGAYYAATDGVLMALASAVLPADLRASSLALLTTATSIARLLASVLFGALWTWWGIQGATLAFLAGLVVAISYTSFALIRTEKYARDAQTAT
jgi:MFS family permease